jgi:hypothetical protein
VLDFSILVFIYEYFIPLVTLSQKASNWFRCWKAGSIVPIAPSKVNGSFKVSEMQNGRGGRKNEVFSFRFHDL